jgi:hypothetical protein
MQNDEGYKPILRPLSSMTDKEKDQMIKDCPSRQNDEGYRVKSIYLMGVECEYISVVMKHETKSKYVRDLTINELLWLMEKGFFVNQCREDECIIETKEG